MPITVVCRKCGRLANVPDSAGGIQCKCSDCGNTIDTPRGGTKLCCVCQGDVTHAERTKDAAGNYYCVQCAKAKQATAEAVAAKASATSGPGTVGESATCAICAADFPRKMLHNFDGDLVCNSCARKEGLGTTPYRIKKTPLGGSRVSYRCPQCKGELVSALDEVGKEDCCPQCGAVFDVPGRYAALKKATSSQVRGSAAAGDGRGSKKQWRALSALLACVVNVRRSASGGDFCGV